MQQLTECHDITEKGVLNRVNKSPLLDSAYDDKAVQFTRSHISVTSISTSMSSWHPEYKTLCYSEMSIPSDQTTRCYTLEDYSVSAHRCLSLISNKKLVVFFPEQVIKRQPNWGGDCLW